MRRTAYILTALLLLIVPSGELICCTSAIFSGKVTASGRPEIWKNRDSGYLQNRVDYQAAGGDIKYSFLYLSNSKGGEKEAWSGVNSAGFSIMNTVSYNIRAEGDTTPDSQMDREGILMFRALGCCTCLEDFEKLLDNIGAPKGLETNFGVIDAFGGAAYYEVNNYSWVKYDVNDPKVAPDGYLIRSNYSFSGAEGKGQGYVRYDSAQKIISERLAAGAKIDPVWIMDKLSRSYYQSRIGYSPLEAGKEFFLDRDFIPRRSTCAVTVVQGVNPGQDPMQCVFWCALGYPPTSQIVPLMMAAGEYVPADMTAKNQYLNSEACNRSLKRKAAIFSSKKSGDYHYIDLNLIRSEIEKSRSSEAKMLSKWKDVDKSDAGQLREFYENIEIR